MRCMYCNHTDSKVVDSRPTEDGTAIRRRRECTGCGRRFTTYEKVDNPLIMVIKKDGRRQPFDGQKIRNGLIKACEKRPIPMSAIDHIVGEVEKAVYNSLDQEITSEQIGEIVMARLKELDQVAYIRFASVYRQFRDLNTLINELNELLHE
ncbi:MAG: transcriptional regulator NrdR [Christensenellales bacterium]|jgi:transcriptional repressor NrdR